MKLFSAALLLSACMLSAPASAKNISDDLLSDFEPVISDELDSRSSLFSPRHRRDICTGVCAFFRAPGAPDDGQWVYVSIDGNPVPGLWQPINNPNLNFTPRPMSQQACVQAAHTACEYFRLYPQFGSCDVIRLRRTDFDRWGRPNALVHPAIVRCH